LALRLYLGIRLRLSSHSSPYSFQGSSRQRSDIVSYILTRASPFALSSWKPLFLPFSPISKIPFFSRVFSRGARFGFCRPLVSFLGLHLVPPRPPANFFHNVTNVPPLFTPHGHHSLSHLSNFHAPVNLALHPRDKKFTLSGFRFPGWLPVRTPFVVLFWNLRFG